MKHVFIAATFSLSVLASLPTQANEVNEALANICTIVGADDKGELRKKMRKVQTEFRLKLSDYYAGVTCGNESLVRHAIKNDAIETGTFMVKRIPKSLLTSPESDGKTLLAWAAEKGKGQSQIVTEVAERIN